MIAVIVNVLIVAVIVGWVGYSVYSMIKEQKEAKKTGIPAGCCGCSVYKKGECPGHNQGKETACGSK